MHINVRIALLLFGASLNNKNNSYCMRLYVNLAKNVLRWIKIRQKYLQLSINYSSSCVHFCKKRVQEGVWLLYIFFRIKTSRKAQVNLSTFLQYEIINSSSQTWSIAKPQLQVDTAILDFSKTFNDVAHSRLLYNLELEKCCTVG